MTNEISKLALRDIAPIIEHLPAEESSSPLLFWWIGLGITFGTLALIFWLRTRSKRPKTPLEKICAALEHTPSTPLEKTNYLAQIFHTLLGLKLDKELEGWTAQQIATLIPEEQNHCKILLQADAFRFSNEIPPDFPTQLEAHVHNLVEELTSKEEAS